MRSVEAASEPAPRNMLARTTSLPPFQSDLALNSLVVFVVAVLYFASQHTLLLFCRSCTRTGVVSGSIGRLDRRPWG